MTDLRQLMHQTVEHDRADMVRLASRAKRHGTVLRRRRRLAVAGGSLAVLAVVAGGLVTAGALAPGAGDAGEHPGFADTRTDPVLVPAPDGPLISGLQQGEWTPSLDCSDRRKDLTFTPVEEAGEALKAAVSSLAEGAITQVRGSRTSATCHHPEAVGASLMLAPADGSADVQISTDFLAPGEFDWAGGAEAYVSTCDLGQAGRENCRLDTLPDGTKLRTFSFSQPSGGVDTTWQVAERLVDGYIVNVNAVGPRVVLSRDQLVDLVSQLTPIA